MRGSVIMPVSVVTVPAELHTYELFDCGTDSFTMFHRLKNLLHRQTHFGYLMVQFVSSLCTKYYLL
jgi:hypothetical protein